MQPPMIMAMGPGFKQVGFPVEFIRRTHALIFDHVGQGRKKMVEVQIWLISIPGLPLTDSLDQVMPEFVPFEMILFT